MALLRPLSPEPTGLPTALGLTGRRQLLSEGCGRTVGAAMPRSVPIQVCILFSWRDAWCWRSDPHFGADTPHLKHWRHPVQIWGGSRTRSWPTSMGWTVPGGVLPLADGGDATPTIIRDDRRTGCLPKAGVLLDVLFVAAPCARMLRCPPATALFDSERPSLLGFGTPPCVPPIDWERPIQLTTSPVSRRT